MKNVGDTVAKLLALSKDDGATLAEAENAAAMAQKLMIKYHLEESDIKRQNNEPQEPVRHLTIPIKVKWEQTLIHYLAINCFCRVVTSRDQIHIFGQKQHIISVCHLFDYLSERFKELGKGESQSFFHGANSGLYTRLKNQRQEIESQQSESNLSLLVVTDTAVTTAMRDMFPNTRSNKRPQIRDSNSYNRGYTVGATIGLDTQIGG